MDASQNKNSLIKLIHAASKNSPIDYAHYINLALYTPHLGYYKRTGDRVGRRAQCDFYTAESLGSCFAQLVFTAAEDLLGSASAKQARFVEIAAEPGHALSKLWPQHPFASTQVIRHGDPLQTNGPVVLFANEWLDALPFHRLIFTKGAWRERGVLSPELGRIKEVLLEQLSPPVLAVAARLPQQAPEGYQLDLPLAAEQALTELLACDWSGLFICFDYGKPWQKLLQDCPSGSARTYKNHIQGNDLLEAPGEKDITCDLNWDPLLALLQSACRLEPTLESQEAFFVNRAQRAAAAIITETAGTFSAQRQTLMQLIHPAHMGQRFQVLWALRD